MGNTKTNGWGGGRGGEAVMKGRGGLKDDTDYL